MGEKLDQQEKTICNEVKVLIVENDDETKRKLVMMLEKRFSTIYKASNGEEGYLIYQQERPEIIITEIKMEPGNGLEMIKKIRKNDTNTQVIILTAYDDNEFFCQAIEYGVNHFILKPILEDKLLTSLNKSAHQVTIDKQYQKQTLFTKTLLNFQEDLILTVNENNQLLDCNDAFTRFFGILRGEPIDLNHYIVTGTHARRENFYDVIDFLISDSNVAHHKLKFKSIDQVDHTFLVKATRIPEENNVLIVCTDISELDKEIKKNEYLAEKDALTKVYNRYKFESLLNQEIQRAKRYGTQLSLIIIDIDHFKDINDTYGHNVGDDILAKVAMLIQDRIRETDILARWGGEEFVILIPETDEKGAKKLAETLRSLIENYQFPIVSKMTSSFGVCQYLDCTTEKDFIYKADTALYQAKNSGRNRVVACEEIITNLKGFRH